MVNQHFKSVTNPKFKLQPNLALQQDVFSEKVLVHNKAIKNMRYKKVLINENPKTEFSDMKKKKNIYI